MFYMPWVISGNLTAELIKNEISDHSSSDIYDTLRSNSPVLSLQWFSDPNGALVTLDTTISSTLPLQSAGDIVALLSHFKGALIPSALVSHSKGTILPSAH
jgi:hypothetical protein